MLQYEVKMFQKLFNWPDIAYAEGYVWILLTQNQFSTFLEHLFILTFHLNIFSNQK